MNLTSSLWLSCVFKLKYVLLNNRRAYVDEQNIYDRRVEDRQENTCEQEKSKNDQIWSNLGIVGSILEKPVQAGFACPLGPV